MQQQSFSFLYVNLNSLAELALRQLAAQILEQPPEADPLPQMTEAEREAHVLASFENLDWSALDGLDFSSSSETADRDEIPEQLSLPVMDEQAAAGDEAFDMERYLANAYGYQERLQARIDDCYRRADLPAMDAALLQLPKELSPLTGQLSGTEMQGWLALYEQGNEVLTGLTVSMRRLDIEASDGK